MICIPKSDLYLKRQPKIKAIFNYGIWSRCRSRLECDHCIKHLYMSSSSKTSSPTKPGCKSCSSKHVPVVKETEKNKIVSPKLSQEEEIDLNIRIDSCGGKLSFFPLKSLKFQKTLLV